jgi:hypothetical protein
VTTFAYSVVEAEQRSTMLVLSGRETPDDATWARAMAELGRFFAGPAADPKRVGVLVITDGGAPSTAQRKALAEVTHAAKFPVAVISTNPLVRGAITAISWVNPAIKAFAPSRWADAVAYSAEGGAEKAMLEQMQANQRTLGWAVHCLDAVVASNVPR